MNQSSLPPRRASADAARARAKMLAQKRKERAQRKLILSLTALLLVITLATVGVLKFTGPSTPPLPPDTAESSTGPISTDPSTDPSDTEPSDTSPQSDPSQTDPSQTDPSQTEPAIPAFSLPSDLESRFVLLIHRESGRVIAEKNADVRSFPASVTKIMTVLVALEQIEDPNATVTITADLINRLVARNAARAGFAAGEQVSAIDLMYAALLPSGADGSVGLAELVSGSESAFAVLMNEKAAEIGMKDTHFVNATGLHEDDHYSTCEDLALLLDYALDIPAFRQIFTTKTYRSSSTAQHSNGIYMRSTMDSYLEEEQIPRNYLLGGKTGYTEQAGLCLASLATWMGEEYILVTLGAGDGTNRPRYQVQDAVTVFDAFFGQLR